MPNETIWHKVTNINDPNTALYYFLINMICKYVVVSRRFFTTLRPLIIYISLDHKAAPKLGK